METVLITGASSGIGRELAKCFAAENCSLLLLARNAPALEALAEELRQRYHIAAGVYVADLSLPETPERVFADLTRTGVQVDVLVNNAGFGANGNFIKLPLDRQLQMLQVNIAALTHLSRLLLPGMVERRRGGLLNVASTAGFQPGPGMAVYYASKAYVLSFTEALAEEVAGTGVTITAVCPGLTDTNFFTVAGGSRDTRISKMAKMSAASVARIGHHAFRKGKVVTITGWHNWLMAFAVRLVPRSVPRKVAYLFNGGKNR